MNWKSRNQWTGLAGVILLLTMLPFAPSKAWACTVSASGSFGVSSQIDSDSVTICAKSTTVVKVVSKPAKPAAPAKPAVPAKPATPAKPAAPAKPIAPAKPVVPVKTALPTKSAALPVKTTAKPVVATKPVVAPKPVVTTKPIVQPKPATTTKPAPKPVAPAKVVTASQTAQARFAPAALSVSASASDIDAGQTVNFSTDASVHFRTATLLGKAAEVRFTPLSTNWVLVGTPSVAAAAMAHRFDVAGRFLVSARVIYGVEYRVSGSSEWIPGGEISVSGSTTVSVASVDVPASTPISQSRALLVSKNCLSRPTAFGCSH